jgi:response regulator NasT
MINSALIVSSTDKTALVYSDILNMSAIKQISVTHSVKEAKRFLLEQETDLVIVDAPLPDESGESFSRSVALKDLSQVIYVVNNELFNETSAVCEQDGVLTISKPLNTDFFCSALSLAKAASVRIKHLQTENIKLKQKIEDIRIIDRAKCLLISYLKMSEQESHRFIEKQAMDLRSSKRTIAEEILKTYAN